MFINLEFVHEGKAHVKATMLISDHDYILNTEKILCDGLTFMSDPLYSVLQTFDPTTNTRLIVWMLPVSASPFVIEKFQNDNRVNVRALAFASSRPFPHPFFQKEFSVISRRLK